MSQNNCEHPCKEEEFKHKWGLGLEEVYKVGLKFLKEKDGTKALHTTYADRLRLVAMAKQASFGAYSPSLLPDNGLFDVVGNNRRQAWQALGDMSKEDAKAAFVDLLNTLCPLFRPVVEAHSVGEEEEDKDKQTEGERVMKEEEDGDKQLQEQQLQRVSYEGMVRRALNQQTYSQFKMYAQLQCPSSDQQQEELIKQLQEQHIQQYMQQVHNQQQLQQQQQLLQQQQLQLQQSQQNQQQQQHLKSQLQQQQYQQIQQQLQQAQQQQQQQLQQQSTGEPKVELNSSPQNISTTIQQQQQTQQNIDINKQELQRQQQQQHQQQHQQQQQQTNTQQQHTSTTTTTTTNGDIPSKIVKQTPTHTPAEWWTRSDTMNFKESLRSENDAVVVAGAGEVVTIRVQTNLKGTCLFWEFATDVYDIGFGLSFEIQGDEGGNEGAERVDEIIPIKRVPSHKEVQCGSHKYPGQGIYLLIFDNSYSLWRTKSVYYRFFYAK